MYKIQFFIPFLSLACLVYAGDAEPPLKPTAQEKESEPSYMPDNFRNKTIVLNYDQVVSYHLSRGDGGWHTSEHEMDFNEIVFDDKEETYIKWEQPAYDGELFVKKLGHNSFALTWQPEVDDENKIEHGTEHVVSFQFTFTGKNEGIGCFSVTSFAGTGFYTNIKFTIKEN